MLNRTRVTNWLVALSVAATVFAVVPAGASNAAPRTNSLYVALGDSYSSGEGLVPFIAGSGSCDRSTQGYPALVAHALRTLTLRFVACSGATSAQISAQVGTVSKKQWRQTALATVSAGGNDLPFSGLISACIGATTKSATPLFFYNPGVNSSIDCLAAVTSAAQLLGGALTTTNDALTIPSAALTLPLRQPSTIETRLRALYLKIMRAQGVVLHRAKGPRLVVVTYPSLLATSGAGACVLSPTPLPIAGPPGTDGLPQSLLAAFTSPASYLLSDLNTYLQLETSIVVAQLRSEGYLGLSLARATSFAPLVCSTGTSPDLNGLLLASTATTSSGGSFHPTSAGQSLLASSVEAAWRASVGRATN